MASAAQSQGFGLLPHLPQGLPPGAGWSNAPHRNWSGDPGEPGMPMHQLYYGGPGGPSGGPGGVGGGPGGAQDDGSRGGGYKCSKCGLPKKGHVCAYQPRLRLKEEDEPKEVRSVGCQAEMDPLLVVRELELALQGTPESYQPVGTTPAESSSSTTRLEDAQATS